MSDFSDDAQREWGEAKANGMIFDDVREAMEAVKKLPPLIVQTEERVIAGKKYTLFHDTAGNTYLKLNNFDDIFESRPPTLKEDKELL